MDDNSKLKMMLFFDDLRREMDNFDYDDKLQVDRFDRKGYYAAVDKMNFLIQEFINNEIKGGKIK